MKPVVPCAACSICALDYGCGFTAPVVMICTRDDGERDRDDGCTRGERGAPQLAHHDFPVSIEGQETVYGDTDKD